jgi:hypothetical protein
LSRRRSLDLHFILSYSGVVLAGGRR